MILWLTDFINSKQALYILNILNILNQMNPLMVIPLSGFHCILKYMKSKPNNWFVDTYETLI